MEKHEVEIHKISRKRLNPDKMTAQMSLISGKLRTLEAKGWKAVIKNTGWQTPHQLPEGLLRYAVILNIVCDRERKPETLRAEFDSIVKRIADGGRASEWNVVLIDHAVADAKDERLPRVTGYAAVDVPSDWHSHFDHIFNRESQIDILMSAINAGVLSDWHDRFHVALIGEPASGKTELLRSIKRLLGEDAVLEYDATATTQAGAIKDLTSRQELPRLLIVEEIEKTDENSLRWLLGVMDHRAEIRKTTFRSHVERETKMLTMATVNDYRLFRRLMSGALASRFAYHIHCPQLDRATLTRILEREIVRVRGKKAWIKPTLDFADEQKISDPRKLLAVCLCGRDGLLGNAPYLKKLRDVSSNNFIQEIG